MIATTTFIVRSFRRFCHCLSSLSVRTYVMCLLVYSILYLNCSVCVHLFKPITIFSVSNSIVWAIASPLCVSLRLFLCLLVSQLTSVCSVCQSVCDFEASLVHTAPVSYQSLSVFSYQLYQPVCVCVSVWRLFFDAYAYWYYNTHTHTNTRHFLQTHINCVISEAIFLGYPFH